MHASEGASGFAYHCIGAHAMNFMGVTFIALFRKKKRYHRNANSCARKINKRKICSENVGKNKKTVSTVFFSKFATQSI